MSAVFTVIAAFVFAGSFLLTGYLCSPASRFHLLDHPNERSLHERLTPRTGGLAIVASLLLGLSAAFAWQWWCGARCEATGQLLGRVTFCLISAVLLVIIVSFIDEMRGLSVAIRLVVHLLAATGVVLGASQMIDVVPVPMLGVLRIGWLAIPVSILFIVWMTNLYNFMDGMDGFAGGMTTIGFGFISYFAWSGRHYGILVIALLVAVAAGGFLFFNLPPARVFMGDVGSTALGFLAGTLAVIGVHDRLFDIWVPVLVFSPFGVDATVTLLLRLARGRRVWHAHREHFYQRLVLAGWGHRRTVLCEYILMFAAGLSAVLYLRVGEPARLVILIGWTCVYTLIAFAIQKIISRGGGLDHVGPDPSAELKRNNSIQI